MMALALASLLVASPLEGRPYTTYVPKGEGERPLLLVLHCLGCSGAWMVKRFALERLADEKGFVLAVPEGMKDRRGKRFWNTHSACCWFDGPEVDDVAYLEAVIEDARARHRIDPRRVYLFGFSNGGFMAHRLACELSELVAGIVSIAGSAPPECAAKGPVAVLQVHGDHDDTVRFGGGPLRGRKGATGRYLSAPELVRRWAVINGCAEQPAPGGHLDLDAKLAGAETEVLSHGGCRAGAAVLWRIRGGPHSPAFNERFAAAAWDFLAAHVRPKP